MANCLILDGGEIQFDRGGKREEGLKKGGEKEKKKTEVVAETCDRRATRAPLPSLKKKAKGKAHVEKKGGDGERRKAFITTQLSPTCLRSTMARKKEKEGKDSDHQIFPGPPRQASLKKEKRNGDLCDFAYERR